jgi:RNA polymerase sigma-70 factor (ECF subfamily)
VTETEQITRASQGDEAAWVGLVRQQQEAVFRLAYLLLGDADDAEDVTQEVFIRAFRALDRFDTARPLRPWLLEITRNQCYNWRRALRRHLAALTRWGQVAPSADVDPNEQMVQHWKADALWQAVRRLRATDQEVVYLRCFLELSVEETAQALAIAPGTVKSRLSRALDRLRGVVEREFPGLREEVAE